MELTRFVQRWTNADYPPEPVSPATLEATEQYFAVPFPGDYRNALLAVGLPRPTIALLDAIVEQRLDLHDVSEFLSPEEVIQSTLDAREGGMPAHLIVFAIDSGGNMFCFDQQRLQDQASDRDAIWIFDHDRGSAKRIAAGFDDWITAFCKIVSS